MIERMARALCIKAGADPDSLWAAPENGEPSLVMNIARAGGPQWPAWRWWAPSARVAIEAMREPTPAMVEAGGGECCNTERWDDQSYEPPAIWRDMIDAALADGAS